MRRRWQLAVFVLVVVAACDRAEDAAAPTPEPPPAATPVPTTVVELPVLADFAVSPPAPDTELTTVEASALEAGEGAVAIFAVERPDVPARCILDARLRLFVEESSGLTSTELAVYPSHVFDAAEKADGERFGYSGALLDARPRAVYQGESGGWTEWDVTGIVTRWVAGDAFPSRGSHAPERGPIVLALRDFDLAAPFATATVASSESAHAPHVTLTSREDCRVRGGA